MQEVFDLNKIAYTFWRKYQNFKDKIYPYRFRRWILFFVLMIYFIYDVVLYKGKIRRISCYYVFAFIIFYR